MPATDARARARERARRAGLPRGRSRGAHTRPRASERTGLRFCGIVEDRPPDASATSPTSLCARSTTSRPTFAAAPAARPGPRRAPRRAGGSCARGARAPRARALVRRGGRPRAPRLRARRAFPQRRRAEPRAARRVRLRVCRVPRARDEPAGRLQPERRRHRLLEEGSCGHRRRAMGAGELRTSVGETVELCEHESRRRDGRRASRPYRRCPGSSLRDGRSRRPRRRPPPRSSRTSGSAGFPTASAVVGEAARVVELGAASLSDPARRRPAGRGRLQRLPSRGRVPRRACPAATRGPRPPLAAPAARRWPRTASHREERRLAGALAGRCRSAARRPPRARRESPAPPARARGAPGPRRSPLPRRGSTCGSPRASGGRARRHRRGDAAPGAARPPTERDRASPSRTRSAPRRRSPDRPKPVNAGLERELLAIVRRMRVATRRVRLPDLDHAVRNRIPGAVEEDARDADRPRVGLVDETGSRSDRR